MTNNFLPLVEVVPVKIASKLQKPLEQVLIHALESEDGNIEILSVGCLSAHDGKQ